MKAAAEMLTLIFIVQYGTVNWLFYRFTQSINQSLAYMLIT